MNTGKKRKMGRMKDDYSVFMETDLSPYIGEWIAICNGKIVSHGNNFKETYAAARKMNPRRRPLMAKVPPAETMILCS